MSKEKQSLKGYGQMYRSGITMKQKWSTDAAIRQEKRESELVRQKAISGASMMGRSTR